jgi:heme-degrading monooxygenase HmoA
MSEFSDFLRHRFAYVAIGEFKPGKFAEAKQLFEQAIATYSQGFKGAYLLQEPGTDKGVAIIFWENMEDIEANQTDVYKEILNKMSHLFAKAPKTAFHEVCSLIQPPVASSVLN